MVGAPFGASCACPDRGLAVPRAALTAVPPFHVFQVVGLRRGLLLILKGSITCHENIGYYTKVR